MKKILLFLSVLSLLSINSTFAQHSNIFHEYFTGLTIGNDLAGQNGWSKVGAGTLTVNATNLNTPPYPNYQTEDGGNSLYLPSSFTTGGYTHAFSTASAKNMYMGLLYEDTSSNHALSTTYNALMSIGSASVGGAIIWVKHVSVGGVDRLKFGVSKNTGNPNWTSWAYQTDSIHLLIVKYATKNVSTTDDSVKLFVDPDLIASAYEPMVPTVSANVTDPDFTGTFSNVSLTFNAPNGYLDDIAVDSNYYYLLDSTHVQVHCKAAFTATSTGLTLNCANNSTGNVAHWAWIFGDNGFTVGSYVYGDSLVHHYAAPGTYRVTLITFWDAAATQVCDSTHNYYTITNVGINGVENEMYANVYYNNNIPFLKINTTNATAMNVDLINILGEKVENVYSSNSTLGQMILQPKMKLTSGIYFYQITSNKENKTIKVVVN